MQTTLSSSSLSERVGGRQVETRFEGVIRRIAVCVVNREKELAKHHMKRILPHYDEMSDIEKEVVDELKLRLFC